MSLSANSQRVWQNHDILLYLCQFMEGQELILFATSCRFFYKIIIDRPNYWERQYRQKFGVDDQREQEWLTWYNWHINDTTKLKELTSNLNKKKRKHSSLSVTTTANNANTESTLFFNYLPSIPNFGTIQWFYAYHRRQQINHNFMAGRFKRQNCQLPFEEHAELKLVEVNPWNGLVWDTKNSKIWSIQHNLFSKKNSHGGKELTWKELTIPLSPCLLNQTMEIKYVSGTHQFVVAKVAIITYEEVKTVFNSVDKHSNRQSTKRYTQKIESCRQTIIVIWRHASNLPAKIIDIQTVPRARRNNSPCLFGIYNNWVPMRSDHMEDSNYTFNLLDLETNQFIKGPEFPWFTSNISTQFTSRKQCQLLKWEIIRNSVNYGVDSTSTITQNLQTAVNDKKSTCIRWELFNAQQEQPQCQKIISDQVTIPYYSLAVVDAEPYTEKTCLVIIQIEDQHQKRNRNENMFLLNLFAFDDFSSNNALQSLFDTRDHGQLLPINSSDQGRLLWSRTIVRNTITKLCNEKLVVIRNHLALDVLDAQNGNILRSIFCVYYYERVPFLGPLCAMMTSIPEENWFVDMHTGHVYKAPAYLISEEAEGNESGSLCPIEVASLPSSFSNTYSRRIEWNVSVGIISRVNKKNGLYEAFML